MDLIRRETRHVTGVSESLGGSGDPSPATAWGVLWAMKAVAERLWGGPSLAGRHVCISGVGKVGAALADHLAEEGAKLTVADVNDAAVDSVVERHGAVPVAPTPPTPSRDIFSPCALGAALNAETIPELACDAVVGSANNQLAELADADRLRQRGVVYAPDFVANAGGVINIAEEPHGYDRTRLRAHPLDPRHPAGGVRSGGHRGHHHRRGGGPPGRGAHRLGQPGPAHTHQPVAAAPPGATVASWSRGSWGSWRASWRWPVGGWRGGRSGCGGSSGALRPGARQGTDCRGGNRAGHGRGADGPARSQCVRPHHGAGGPARGALRAAPGPRAGEHGVRAAGGRPRPSAR